MSVCVSLHNLPNFDLYVAYSDMHSTSLLFLLPFQNYHLEKQYVELVYFSVNTFVEGNYMLFEVDTIQNCLLLLLFLDILNIYFQVYYLHHKNLWVHIMNFRLPFEKQYLFLYCKNPTTDVP